MQNCLSMPSTYLERICGPFFPFFSERQNWSVTFGSLCDEIGRRFDRHLRNSTKMANSNFSNFLSPKKPKKTEMPTPKSPRRSTKHLTLGANVGQWTRERTTPPHKKKRKKKTGVSCWFFRLFLVSRQYRYSRCCPVSLGTNGGTRLFCLPHRRRRRRSFFGRRIQTPWRLSGRRARIPNEKEKLPRRHRTAGSFTTFTFPPSRKWRSRNFFCRWARGKKYHEIVLFFILSVATPDWFSGAGVVHFFLLLKMTETYLIVPVASPRETENASPRRFSGCSTWAEPKAERRRPDGGKERKTKTKTKMNVYVWNARLPLVRVCVCVWAEFFVARREWTFSNLPPHDGRRTRTEILSSSSASTLHHVQRRKWTILPTRGISRKEEKEELTRALGSVFDDSGGGRHVAILCPTVFAIQLHITWWSGRSEKKKIKREREKYNKRMWLKHEKPQ